jgi:peptidoglycan-associated lipoprotein
MVPALAVAVLLFALNLGCAKKATETAPTPAPTPPVTKTEPPVPPPPPPPAPAPETKPSVSASDFQDAFFDLDSYALRDDGRASLDKDAKLLRDNAKVAVTIEGHCDERGTAEYNQALGEKRANAARDYLTAAGIDGGRIQTISYGKERPFDAGHDEAAWAKNRRAHVVMK